MFFVVHHRRVWPFCTVQVDKCSFGDDEASLVFCPCCIVMNHSISGHIILGATVSGHRTHADAVAQRNRVAESDRGEKR